MVMIEDPLNSIKRYDEKGRYDGLRIFDYEGLSLRQRENLEGLWKDRKVFRHRSDEIDELVLYGNDENNIQAAICLQALYRRANALYHTFPQNKFTISPKGRVNIDLANVIITLFQASRYFAGNTNHISEDTQTLCKTIEENYSLPKPEYLLLLKELSRILADEVLLDSPN